jgi:hypothetical protein
LRERTGADDAAALVAGWFADSTELHLVDSMTEGVADRLLVAYRLEGIEGGDTTWWWSSSISSASSPMA